MATYDLHQHLWPPAFVEALRGRTDAPRLVGDELVTIEGRFPIALDEHDLEVRLRALDRDGIDVAVLSLQPSLGLDELQRSEAEGLEEAWVAGVRALSDASGGRLRAFSPSAVGEGLAGVSVGSAVFADLDASAPLLDAISDAGLMLFVHPDAGTSHGDRRPAWWEWVVGYPSRMQEAYLAWLAFGRSRWPTLRVVFAMLGGGGPFQLERLARRGVDVRSALDPNTFFDVSTHGRRAIELCLQTFGVGQLVYGSDTPVVDPQPTLDAVRGFGDAVTHVLQTDTPERLLT